MRGCLGKHSCMSSPFPIAILNGTCSLRALRLFCGDVHAIKTKLNKLIEASGLSHAASCLNRKGKFHSVWYRKRATHARVFSWTLAHGNCNIEIRQLKIKGKKVRRKEWMWKKAQWARKSPVDLNVQSHLISSSHFSHSRQSVLHWIYSHKLDLQLSSEAARWRYHRVDSVKLSTLWRYAPPDGRFFPRDIFFTRVVVVVVVLVVVVVP